MKISFLLPSPPWEPVGGYRVVYEYANQLVSFGHQVSVVHPSYMENIHKNQFFYKTAVKNIAYVFNRLTIPSVSWLKLDRRVKMVYVKDLTSKNIPDADIVFATAWQTAEYASGLPEIKGNKFYLIMDFFPWFASKETLYGTWKLPFKKIAISGWLRDHVKSTGISDVCAITLGIDHSVFKINIPIINRKPIISFMYSTAKYKDIDTAISALEICKENQSDINVAAFGPKQKPRSGFPSWINHLGSLPANDLAHCYNMSSVFISSSIAEGFAFPPAEAMACGCAVASTDCGGITDYAINGNNALLSAPGNPDALAHNILRLLRDEELRLNISNSGYSRIKDFTWEKSARLLEKELYGS